MQGIQNLSMQDTGSASSDGLHQLEPSIPNPLIHIRIVVIRIRDVANMHDEINVRLAGTDDALNALHRVGRIHNAHIAIKQEGSVQIGMRRSSCEGESLRPAAILRSDLVVIDSMSLQAVHQGMMMVSDQSGIRPELLGQVDLRFGLGGPHQCIRRDSPTN